MENELTLFQGVSETALIEQYSEIKSRVIDITIDNETVYEATDFGKRITKLVKDVDAARKTAVEPLETAITQIEIPYKNLSAELKKIKKTLDDKMSAYFADQRKKEEERQRIEREKQVAALKEAEQKAAMDGKIEDVQVIETAVQHVESAPIKTTASVRGFTGASASSRKTWKYRIIDPALVPRHLCIPSESLITAAKNTAIKDGTIENLEIPGIEFYEEYGVSYH